MTSRIEGEVKVQLQENGVDRVLLEPLECVVGNGAIRVEIPAGTVINYASVPRLFWRIFPPAQGKYLKATIPHDYLYEMKGFPKVVADGIFLDVMKADGVGWFKRHTMFIAVLIFGGFARRKCLRDK